MAHALRRRRMAREVSLGKRPPWSRLSLPLSPFTTNGVHLAPSRLRAPTGAATCSSPAHGACALRHRDRMAPVVVAANSRGGYPRLPTEQRVTTSSCSARAQQSRESPTRCRMVAVVPMRIGQDPPRPWPTPMAPMDGSNGTEASDCVDVPPVRLCDPPSRRATAVDRVTLGAPVPAVRSAASDQDARRVGLSPGARNTTQTAEQSSAQAHSSCEQGAGQRARSSRDTRVTPIVPG